jgi:hypothetical protein
MCPGAVRKVAVPLRHSQLIEESLRSGKSRTGTKPAQGGHQAALCVRNRLTYQYAREDSNL